MPTKIVKIFICEVCGERLSTEGKKWWMPSELIPLEKDWMLYGINKCACSKCKGTVKLTRMQRFSLSMLPFNYQHKNYHQEKNEVKG
jgi:hypothetical protein